MHSYRVDWYHQVPPSVKEILATLHKNGHTAYIVGGAVRDLWLGLKPKDFDLASNASVEQIALLFPKTLEIGKQFGIMVVVTDEGPVEIARFRTDGEYTDSRHPDSVAFCDPAEDARRRDFTMNALFYDTLGEEVLDYVGGIPDVKNKLLRTVGEPAIRFAEDALRMLRAFRFFSQIPGSRLDPSILAAIAEEHTRIKNVSKERLTQELQKLCVGSQVDLAFSALGESHLLSDIFEIKPWSNLESDDFRENLYFYKAHFSNTVPFDFFLYSLLCSRREVNFDRLVLVKRKKTF